MKQSTFLKIYILPLIFISPIITMSCNSWFSMWMMLELNTMSFIPFMIYMNKYYKELTFKYFIIQNISSSMIIMFSTLKSMNLNMKMLYILLMNLSMMMKLGMFPFQYWYINMMNNSTWLNCLILSTWQKIIPMYLLTKSYEQNYIYLTMMLSSFISVMLSLNNQSIRIMISYSSINHMSWMILNLMINELMWLLYFTIYSTMNITLMMMLNKYKIFYINQMFFSYKIKYKWFINLNILAISGLPPFIGFYMKLMTILNSLNNKLYMMIMFLMYMSMIAFIFYTRIIMSILLMSTYMNKLQLSTMNFHSIKFNNYFITIIINMWILNLWL